MITSLKIGLHTDRVILAKRLINVAKLLLSSSGTVSLRSRHAIVRFAIYEWPQHIIDKEIDMRKDSFEKDCKKSYKIAFNDDINIRLVNKGEMNVRGSKMIELFFELNPFPVKWISMQNQMRVFWREMRKHGWQESRS